MKTYKVHAFYTGNHISRSGQGGIFGNKEISQMAMNFSDARRIPMILGHKQDSNSPAFGWVKSAKYTDGNLYLDINANKAGAALIDGKYYSNVSISCYPPEHPANPKPGEWSLRHVALLGAEPPALKSLDPILENVEFGEYSEETDTPVITGVMVDELWEFSGNRRTCSKGFKSCGRGCIPNHWECHVDGASSDKRVSKEKYIENLKKSGKWIAPEEYKKSRGDKNKESKELNNQKPEVDTQTKEKETLESPEEKRVSNKKESKKSKVSSHKENLKKELKSKDLDKEYSKEKYIDKLKKSGEYITPEDFKKQKEKEKQADSRNQIIRGLLGGVASAGVKTLVLELGKMAAEQQGLSDSAKEDFDFYADLTADVLGNITVEQFAASTDSTVKDRLKILGATGAFEAVNKGALIAAKKIGYNVNDPKAKALVKSSSYIFNEGLKSSLGFRTKDNLTASLVGYATSTLAEEGINEGFKTGRGILTAQKAKEDDSVEARIDKLASSSKSELEKLRAEITAQVNAGLDNRNEQLSTRIEELERKGNPANIRLSQLYGTIDELSRDIKVPEGIDLNNPDFKNMSKEQRDLYIKALSQTSIILSILKTTDSTREYSETMRPNEETNDPRYAQIADSEDDNQNPEDNGSQYEETHKEELEEDEEDLDEEVLDDGEPGISGKEAVSILKKMMESKGSVTQSIQELADLDPEAIKTASQNLVFSSATTTPKELIESSIFGSTPLYNSLNKIKQAATLIGSIDHAAAIEWLGTALFIKLNTSQSAYTAGYKAYLAKSLKTLEYLVNKSRSTQFCEVNIRGYHISDFKDFEEPSNGKPPLESNVIPNKKTDLDDIYDDFDDFIGDDETALREADPESLIDDPKALLTNMKKLLEDGDGEEAIQTAVDSPEELTPSDIEFLVAPFKSICAILIREISDNKLAEVKRVSAEQQEEGTENYSEPVFDPLRHKQINALVEEAFSGKLNGLINEQEFTDFLNMQYDLSQITDFSESGTPDPFTLISKLIQSLNNQVVYGQSELDYAEPDIVSLPIIGPPTDFTPESLAQLASLKKAGKL